MLFDHDAEIGAFLLLNLDRSKIEGYLYRLDEIKETQEVMRDDPKNPDKQIKVKEDVVVQTDWYVMDCQGNWFNIKESTNPFLYYLPYFVSYGYAEDKSKLEYPILKDWILNLFHGEPSEVTGVSVVNHIPHENLTDEQVEQMGEEAIKALSSTERETVIAQYIQYAKDEKGEELNATERAVAEERALDSVRNRPCLAHYEKFRINMELLDKSANWIQQAMTPETEEELKNDKFDGKKKLLRKLDEFEYDIGDKK
jgi:hypothetical protein